MANLGRIADLMRQLAAEVELLTAENEELRRTVAHYEQQRDRGAETPPEQTIADEMAEPPQSPEKDASSVQSDSAPKGGKLKAVKDFFVIGRILDERNRKNAAQKREKENAKRTTATTTTPTPVASMSDAEAPVTPKGTSKGARKESSALAEPPELWAGPARSKGLLKKVDRWAFVRSLDGHREGVWEVAVCPNDASVIASASYDGTARLWSVDGAGTALFAGHKGSVNSVRFQPAHSGPRLLATASSDSTVHVWRVPSTLSTPLLPIPRASAMEGIPKSASETLFPADLSSPDRSDDEATAPYMTSSAFVLTPSSFAPPTPQLGSAFDVPAQSAALVFRDHTDVVVAVDWLAGGDRLVSGSWDSSLRVWNVHTTACEQSVRVEFPSITADSPHLTNVKSHPTSPWHVVAAGTDGLCRVWDLRSNMKLIDLLAHSMERTPATHAMFSHDGGLIFSGGDDRTLKVWDARNTQTALECIRCGAVPARFSLSQRTNTLLVPMQDRKTKICDSQGNTVGSIDTHKHGHRGILTSAQWSEDETLVFVSSLDGSHVSMWALK